MPRRCQYVEEVGNADRKKSLHDVLRERRAAKPLVGVRELQLREASRRREEAEATARELVERWRLRQKSVDAEGKLAPEVYRAIFALSREAYYGSRHWTRRSRAQVGLMSFCEVKRCAGKTDLRAHHLHHDALGAERAGHDVVTLCEPCGRRARKRGAELGRLPTHDEMRELDPHESLFDPEKIAALRARYARPLRHSDVQKSRRQ